MTERHYLFIDDTTGPESDGERYRRLLNKEGELRVSLLRPRREDLLVPEAEVAEDVDGYILDINLSDQVDEEGRRFLGTGAGLAQDLRLLQALGDNGGQRARPVVRLCATQVFQDYLAGDNSTADIFDLGFDKESVGDIAGEARSKLAALPSLYEDVLAIEGDPSGACKLVGLELEAYQNLHSRFRTAFESELVRKPHEAVSFMLRQLLEAPGLLIDERLLSVRLGIDPGASPGWPDVLEAFGCASYRGTGAAAFKRWWADAVLTKWAELTGVSLFKGTAQERVNALTGIGFGNLSALAPSPESPGDRPWAVSVSDDEVLRLPTDPRFAFPVVSPLAPWLDEPLWCLEQAKRNRNAPQLSQDARAQLKITLARIAAAGRG